jgi:hypothetical protein
MPNSIHFGKGSTTILPRFGLDPVPEVGGLGAPAFAASSPDDGVPGAVRAGGGSALGSGRGGNDERTGGFRAVGAPRYRTFAVMLADQVTARQIEHVDRVERDDER